MVIEAIIPSDGGFLTFPNTNIKLIGFYGLGIPEAKGGRHEYSNANGGLFLSQHYRARRFVVEGFVNCQDNATYLETRKELFQAFSFLNAQKLLRFTLPDGRELQSYVIGVGKPTDEERGPSTSYFVFELESSDPLLYSQELKTATGGVATLTGTGFSLPFSLPLALSGSVTGLLAVMNEGNFRVYPESITITGPLTDFTLTNKTTNKSLTFTGSLEEGDTLVINPKRHTAVKNGSENVYNSITWDEVDLYYGSNSFALTVGSDDTVDTGYTIAWRDAYIGK